jgi:hypothetical protein
VEDIITSPSHQDQYTALKAELLNRLSSTREQRARQIITHEEMGDRKPSQFLRHLRSIAPDLPEYFLRSIWCSRLPRPVQPALAGQLQIGLDAAARCADSIMDSSSNISRLHILPHRGRPFHALARSNSHPGHHCRDRGTRPRYRLDIPHRLPADRHHRPRTSFGVATVSLPGQTVWNTAVPDNRPTSCSQRARGTLPPVTQSSHHVPRGPTLDRGASPGSPRYPRSIQNGPAGVSSRARPRRPTQWNQRLSSRSSAST